MTATPSRIARLPFYYGWVVIGVAFVTMAFSVNVRTSFSLLFPPILDEFGWDRATTAAAFTVGFVGSTAFAPLIGILMDRFGPRFVIPLGGVIVAAGLVLTTYISSPIGLYVTLGLMVVGGSVSMSYLGHSMFVPNWFVRRRGLAVGLAFSGVGLGSIAILPALQSLIDTAGWRDACLILALALIAVVAPMNILLQRRRPADVGLLPDGNTQSQAEIVRGSAADTVVDRAWTETQWTLRMAARTSRFWWIYAGYFTALFAWYSVQVHQTRYLVDSGFDAGMAATALGLVGLCGVVGQIGIGAFSDRVGREWGWTIALSGYLMCYLMLLMLEDNPSPALLYAMIGAQGLLGYGLASMYGVIANDIFGGPRFATIFSVLALGGNLGAGVGPWVTGFIFDQSGAYAPAFVLCAVLSVISIGCMWMAAPRKVRLVAGQAERRAASRQ